MLTTFHFLPFQCSAWLRLDSDPHTAVGTYGPAVAGRSAGDARQAVNRSRVGAVRVGYLLLQPLRAVPAQDLVEGPALRAEILGGCRPPGTALGRGAGQAEELVERALDLVPARFGTVTCAHFLPVQCSISLRRMNFLPSTPYAPAAQQSVGAVHRMLLERVAVVLLDPGRIRSRHERPALAVPAQRLVLDDLAAGRRVVGAVVPDRPATGGRGAGNVEQHVLVAGQGSGRGWRGDCEPLLAGPVQDLVQIRPAACLIVADRPAVQTLTCSARR